MIAKEEFFFYFYFISAKHPEEMVDVYRHAIIVYAIHARPQPERFGVENAEDAQASADGREVDRVFGQPGRFRRKGQTEHEAGQQRSDGGEHTKHGFLPAGAARNAANRGDGAATHGGT